MAAFESSYTSLLQGVSQQISRLRQPGQLTALDNMLSDPVTGPRRRPGAEYRYRLTAPMATGTSVKAIETDISGFKVHVILECRAGTVFVMNQQFEVLAELQSDYIVADDIRYIRTATVGNELFLVNVNQRPVLRNDPPVDVIDPARRGFFYIVAGAFSKTYDITITTNLGTKTGTYTTPAASASGAATAALPENIASSIVTNFTAAALTEIGITATRSGPYVYFQGSEAVTSTVVATEAGTTYVTVSKASQVRSESNLPERLPEGANGYIMAVGQQKILTYYRYDHATLQWLEAGKYGSATGIGNMPISLKYDGELSQWVLDSSDFEGRTAGDDESNPVPRVVENGITGCGAYQGRLVLLSGFQVLLSSSKQPRRFMRSTVTSLLDEDPIGVGSGANSSASYEYAVPFQKDLLLFSEKYQALIPGSNQAITPRTATVLVTSTFSADVRAEPVPIGRTLLYPTPLSSDFFGMMELISSQYTDSQYVSNLATEHLPKYMAGSCRFGASSSVASMVVFGQSRDSQGLIVYQYTWSGDEKVQQAWHKWNFAYPVAHAYFSGEAVNLLFVMNGRIVGCRIDPKQGVLSFSSTRRPYLDLYEEIEVVDRQFTIPQWLREFDPNVGDKLRLSQSMGGLAGERVGVESYDPATGIGRTVRSFRNGTVAFGIPYRSLISPSAPMVSDSNGIKIDSNKLTLLRYGVTTQNSSEYMVVVQDGPDAGTSQVQGTLRWSSTELDLGRARYADNSYSVVPARTNAERTSFQLYTDGLGELNVTNVEYVCRYFQKLRRR